MNAHRNHGADAVIFDGDDTLWHNNRYFKEAIARFCELVGTTRWTSEQVRQRLGEVQRANCARVGYGAKVFAQNLIECYEDLVGPCPPATETVFRNVGQQLCEHPIVLVDGAHACVTRLARERPVYLLTKGDRDEQRRKVELSGLEALFDDVFIVDQKDRAQYERIIECTGADAQRSWMIGNSITSDVTPALAVGLNAIWVPHPDTPEWDDDTRDAEMLRAHDETRLRTARSISEVPDLIG
ncbi:MAG: putative hydrolase of the superfamily [Actinomycetota bacterium]|jgi:putative hydrolase of the HAD superfamily